MRRAKILTHRTSPASSSTRPTVVRGPARHPRRPGWGLGCGLIALLLVLTPPAIAQQEEKPLEGVNRGNYNIKQSFEIGGRWTDFTGNLDVYRTFVDLEEGPRLLEHTLEMRSLNHKGLLFDDFFLHSFGYGGDPENVTRLRAYKNRWYNFSATFHRNRNFWDFNLLANPLNPPTSNPTLTITNSPHRLFLVRRRSDVNLTLLPQSIVRLRFGYGRNVMEGPSFSSFHEGTDILVFQNWKTTLDNYSAGIDLRIFPRTNISYDQFFTKYKGDTTWESRSLNFQLADGRPVDLGLIFNTAANQPCATPLLPNGTVNPTCNAFLAYSRQGRVRTLFPTEQLSFQSSYFRNVDFSGRIAYSSADNELVGYEELFRGRVTRTNQSEITTQAPAQGRRVSVTGDLAATFYATDKFKVVDTFHWQHFRIPGQVLIQECSQFSTSMLITANTFPAVNPLLNCPRTNTLGTPVHTASSPADILIEDISKFLGQDTRTNTFELLYDFTRRAGVRLGYRYTHREIAQRLVELADLHFFPDRPNRGACAGRPLEPDGSCRVTTTDSHGELFEINEHVLLFGFWARPVDAWRIAFDLEAASADRAFTRISPRQFQIYRLRTSYRARDWASFNGSIMILERRNNVAQIEHLQHDRSYSVNALLQPNETFMLDFGYDFNDVFSQTNICFTVGAAPPPPGSVPCPFVGGLPLQGLSFYNHDVHYGHFQLMWKPVRRLTTHLGYAVTSTTGSTLILAPNAPPGPLSYNYHKPMAGLSWEMNRNVTWKVQWGYYGYNEKQVPDVFSSPRDFRGNLVLGAVRFDF
jgi:hypothetical protein